MNRVGGRYFKYRQLLRHLIEDRRLLFAEIVARSSDYAAIEADCRAKIRSRTSFPEQPVTR